ncbi:MAG TPA: ABC transporter ATP-binding protein [Flavobacterium sp.]|nr:ABC transporter ATP-binding protein [Flavobacterium sp.]
MVKTVIFDMDGVIVDTEPVHRYAYYQHFDELNIQVAETIFTTFTGYSTRNTYQKLKDLFPIDAEVEDLIQRKRTLFNDAFDRKEDLYLIEGVEPLIQDLHRNGMQLIVASSAAKVTIERVFNRFDLHQYFTHIVSGEDFPNSKPHPAIFEYAVSLSTTPRENCIVIEDSTNGIKAAKAAGIFCVGYKSENSKLQDLSLADAIVESFNILNFERISKY